MSEGGNPYAVPSPAERPSHVTVAEQPDGTRIHQIDVEIGVDDIVDFNAFHVTESPAGRRQTRSRRIVLAIYAAILAAPSLSSLAEPSRLDWLMVSLFAFVCVLIPAWPAIQRVAVRRSIRSAYASARNLGSLGPRQVTLTPREIRIRGPYTDDRVHWIAIENVEAGSSALYLYTSGANGYVIPRRAFASDSEFDSFVALAREYQARAGSV